MIKQYTRAIFPVCASVIFAIGPTNSSSNSRNADIEYVIWDGNRISTIHGNRGEIISSGVTNYSGLEWPKGSRKLASYQAGHWLGAGKVRVPDGEWIREIRTASAAYGVEYVPGQINGNDQSGHIYQIHREELNAFLEYDYTTFSGMTLELPVSVIEGASIHTELVTTTLPTSDFLNWPVEEGAPWVDANGDGQYQLEDGDHPDILGDMFHWYVTNDADSTAHANYFGSNPLNVEIQMSLFGFDQEGPLGDMLFIRQVITNQGSDDLDSVFISFYHDDDIGDAGDDRIGCDTELNLGYTYNMPGGDVTYGEAVPAVGSVFHQGPIVASVGDTAQILTWDLDNNYYFKKIPDYKLLLMTRFLPNLKNAPNWHDPHNAIELYRIQNGRDQHADTLFTDWVTGEKTEFVFSGDPVSGTGWNEEYGGDRRFIMSSGPFTLLAGDTQEIITSVIIAGGTAWNKSIGKLKAYARYAQQDFRNLFSVCNAPETQVKAAMLDGKIILSWEEGSKEIESYQCSGFTFQGYNVYQGASLEGPWTNVATYDLVDGYGVIYSGVINDITGEVHRLPVHDGSDSGLEHFIVLDHDYLRDEKIVNNRTYYYAVTAYTYNPDPEITFSSFESEKTSILAIPGSSPVGTKFDREYADTLEVKHVAGNAVGINITPIVADPYLLNGHTYNISFTAVDDSTNFWALIDSNTTDTLVYQENFPVTAAYYQELSAYLRPGEELQGVGEPTSDHAWIRIIDGFVLTMKNATYLQPQTHSGYTVLVDGDDDPIGTPVKFQGIWPTALSSEIGDGSWNAFLSSIPQLSQAYGSPSGEDMKKDIQIRFTDEGSIATYFNNHALVGGSSDSIWLPFEMWTVEPEDTQQVNTAVYQIAASKPIFETHLPSGGTIITKNVAFMPVYEPYNGFWGLRPDGADGQKMGWMLQLNKEESIFRTGDVFQVHFNNQLVPGEDVYTFSGQGIVTEISKGKIKDQINQINVFPNPYFGGFNNVHYPDDRYVYFANLGVGKTTIRIFTLSGDLVARVEKVLDSPNDADRHARWDLHNSFGKQVVNGIYIVHITVEDTQGKKLGERILKLAVARTASIY